MQDIKKILEISLNLSGGHLLTSKFSYLFSKDIECEEKDPKNDEPLHGR